MIGRVFVFACILGKRAVRCSFLTRYVRHAPAPPSLHDGDRLLHTGWRSHHCAASLCAALLYRLHTSVHAISIFHPSLLSPYFFFFFSFSLRMGASGGRNNSWSLVKYIPPLCKLFGCSLRTGWAWSSPAASLSTPCFWIGVHSSVCANIEYISPRARRKLEVG